MKYPLPHFQAKTRYCLFEQLLAMKVDQKDSRKPKIKTGNGVSFTYTYLGRDLKVEKVLGKSRDAYVCSRNAMGTEWLRVGVISGGGLATMPVQGPQDVSHLLETQTDQIEHTARSSRAVKDQKARLFRIQRKQRKEETTNDFLLCTL